MSGRTPWGINHIGSMIASNVQTQTPDGRWVRAVPVPYKKNFLEAIRAAWWVLTGKAEAVVWPIAGELEFALSGGFEARVVSPFKAKEGAK